MHVDILNLHAHRCANTREGVHHESDQRAITQSDRFAGVDSIKKRTGFVGTEHRGLAFLDRVFRTAYRVGRVRRDDLADH
ncbi:MAG: hypothetical protein WBB96_12820, partial [Candidatus Dechloromonas phosphoritropha]